MLQGTVTPRVRAHRSGGWRVPDSRNHPKPYSSVAVYDMTHFRMRNRLALVIVLIVFTTCWQRPDQPQVGSDIRSPEVSILWPRPNDSFKPQLICRTGLPSAVEQHVHFYGPIPQPIPQPKLQPLLS